MFLLPMVIKTKAPPSKVFAAVRKTVCVCVCLAHKGWGRYKQLEQTVFVSRCDACRVVLVSSVDPNPRLDTLNQSICSGRFAVNAYLEDWRFAAASIQSALAAHAVVVFGDTVDVSGIDLDSEFQLALPRPPMVVDVPDRRWHRAAKSLCLGSLEIDGDDETRVRVLRLKGGQGCVLVVGSDAIPFARGHDLLDCVHAVASPLPSERTCLT